LYEVEKYIRSNRHLPDIPAAVDVEKEGLDIGEINKKLLQKIEELTLYLIDQQKQIDQLRQQNEIHYKELQQHKRELQAPKPEI
jgi:TolA-binding protein